VNETRLRMRSWLLAAPLLSLALAAQADTPHTNYALDVLINPVTHELKVRADIELPETYAGQTLEFLLTDAVEIIKAEPAVKRLPKDNSQGFTGINGSSVEMNDNEHAARYQVKLPPGSTTLHFTYRGTINFAI